MSESKLIFIDEARIALNKQGGAAPPPLREINIATMGGSRTEKPAVAGGASEKPLVAGGDGDAEKPVVAAIAAIAGGAPEKPLVAGGDGETDKPLVAGGDGEAVTADKLVFAGGDGDAVTSEKPVVVSFGGGGSLYLPGSPASSEASSPRSSSSDGQQSGGEGDIHGGAMEGEKEDDKWSISTDELMGMSPYYMILEKFFKHESNTTAQLLREILDEVKGLRQDLRVDANRAN